MKKNNLLIVSITIIISSVLFSCSSMNNLTIRVTEPSPVYLSEDIKAIGIIDRSLPTEKSSTIDVLDKILSAEGKNLDKDAANQSILGLRDELLSRNRFDAIKIIENSNLRSTTPGMFPPTLTWDQVQKICDNNKVDAIYVLSFYDTDTKIDVKTVPVQVTGPLGAKINTIETQLTVNTLINQGWRIYDPMHKVIADEYVMRKNIVSSGRGINPLRAASAIIGRKDAVLNSSNNLAREYAGRIFNYNIRVSRQYYVRGTDNFKIGKRRAQTGDWDGAADLWERETLNSKAKIAGRAYYNMAIINEINGNLDDAVDWASKAYADFKNKEALQYIRILKNRIEKNKQL